jgi:hypothetical protein
MRNAALQLQVLPTSGYSRASSTTNCIYLVSEELGPLMIGQIKDVLLSFMVVVREKTIGL